MGSPIPSFPLQPPVNWSPARPDRPLLGGSNQTTIGVTAGTTPVTMVTAPLASTYKVVYTVTLYNPDSGNSPIILIQINPSGTQRVVYAQAAMATKTSATITFQGGLVLIPKWSLEVVGATAPTTEVHWSAHWADPLSTT